MKYKIYVWLATFIILTSSNNIVSAVKGNKIEIDFDTGKNFAAYIFEPADKANIKGGVLLTHDWFGITDQTMKFAEYISGLGYRTLAVDLYNNESAKTHAAAYKLMTSVAKDEANKKLQAGLNYLKQPGLKLATIGFSMGSVYALEANFQDPSSVSASVVVYGEATSDSVKIRLLQSPVLVIMGSKDTPRQTLEFYNVMEKENKLAEIYIYPGVKHAFSQPLFNEGRNYDENAKQTSRMLIIDFLDRNLGS